MSGADDQRAAERLRDVVVCHCYEIAGPVGGGHWASCLAEEIGDEVTAVLVDRDRLRAELEHVTGLLAEARTHRGNALDFARERQRELAETRAAGDSLAAIASVMTEDSTTERWDSLGEAIHTYWSVRGDARTAPAADVRDPADEGDGLMSLLDEHWPVDIFRTDPMEDAADPGPRIVALLRWVDRLRAELAETRAELHGATGAAAVLRERGDALADATNALLDQWRWLNERSRPDGASTCETRLVEWRSVRGDAPTQPPAPVADVRDPAGETHRTSAAPTAAPDVRAWEDDGDWGWACSRCGYRSVAWWADRATARRAAHEHGRDRCPAAGGSSPASTDGGEQ
ncbi:hypothetical protein [Pseudonocardia parietis]|uniref:Uncharacterized protein n=1 Tax=Pseudonocardia parietis TaxID=570936 RepID=A0ABS4W261_9PSEU|nr:hypothetical protein [Pseudonocardia parietis]MBP2370266.1 hypothetical protein [Pseudonocardia parietis]